MPSLTKTLISLTLAAAAVAHPLSPYAKSVSLPAAFDIVPTNIVEVGPNGKLVYDPPFLTAPVGSTLAFRFHAKNHTVTQSSLEAPCTSISKTSGGAILGIDTDFHQFVSADEDAAGQNPVVDIKVSDDQPLFIYCRQSGHCSSGMVFVLNPTPTNGDNGAAFFEAFQNSAKATAGQSKVN